MLDLSNCGFSGSLPGQWARLTSLQQLNLSRSHFQGSLPASWAALTSLTHLDVSRCRLTGQLPATYSTLSHNAVLLEFSYNRLSGAIPYSYGQLAAQDSNNILRLDLAYNKNLTSCVPVALFGSRVRLRLVGTAVKALAMTRKGRCCPSNSVVDLQYSPDSCRKCEDWQVPTLSKQRCASKWSLWMNVWPEVLVCVDSIIL